MSSPAFRHIADYHLELCWPVWPQGILTSFPLNLIDRITGNWAFYHQICSRYSRNFWHLTNIWKTVNVYFGTVSNSECARIKQHFQMNQWSNSFSGRAVHSYFPIIFCAVQVYSPPSSSFTLVMLTWLITSSCMVTYWPTRNLSGSYCWKCSRHSYDAWKWWNVTSIDTVNNFSKYTAHITREGERENRTKLTGNPSSFHVNCGGGFPVATHFNETVGPGWSVCSENQYKSSGEASKLKMEKTKTHGQK